MTLSQPPAKTGIFAGFSFRTPFPERMRMVRNAGFDATALWWDDRHPRAKEMREVAPGIVRDAGLDIDHVHAPFQRSAAFWSADDAERLAVVEEYRHYIQTCARFGVPRMVMHVATGASTPPPGEPGLDTFRRLLDEAEAQGVTIAIENTRLPGHVDYLLTKLPHPRLGLCHDTSHARLYAQGEHDLIERHAKRLAATHLSDTDGRRDLHLLPGDGVCDYAPTVRAIHKTGATALLEVRHRDRNESDESFLRRAHARLTETIAAAQAA